MTARISARKRSHVVSRSTRCRVCGDFALARQRCPYHYKLWRHAHVPGALEADRAWTREYVRRRRAAGTMG